MLLKRNGICYANYGTPCVKVGINCERIGTAMMSFGNVGVRTGIADGRTGNRVGSYIKKSVN